MSIFAPQKMCAFQRNSGLVVIRQVARLSRIGARLMFGPLGTPRRPRGPSGALSGPDGRPAARRRLHPTDFHRRPPVWAARHSYRRRPGLLLANAGQLAHDLPGLGHGPLVSYQTCPDLAMVTVCVCVTRYGDAIEVYSHRNQRSTRNAKAH